MAKRMCIVCGERPATVPDRGGLLMITNQAIKADLGKPRLSLVPTEILYAIATTREYGNRKYGDPDSWRTVEVSRYRDAAYRHLIAYIAEPQGRDEESGLPHLWHLACNVAFLCAMEKGGGANV